METVVVASTLSQRLNTVHTNEIYIHDKFLKNTSLVYFCVAVIFKMVITMFPKMSFCVNRTKASEELPSFNRFLRSNRNNPVRKPFKIVGRIKPS